MRYCDSFYLGRRDVRRVLLPSFVIRFCYIIYTVHTAANKMVVILSDIYWWYEALLGAWCRGYEQLHMIIVSISSLVARFLSVVFGAVAKETAWILENIRYLHDKYIHISRECLYPFLYSMYPRWTSNSPNSIKGNYRIFEFGYLSSSL